VGKLLLVVRVRGVTDISKQQKIILSKLGLRRINTAVFVRGTAANIKQLGKVENYITWGEPSKKLVSELVYRKLYGKVGEERVQVKSNAQVEEHLGGDIICLEDIIKEVCNLGSSFEKITNFVFPFKLTTPEGTLASRIRKPVSDNGHWGYRGEEISEYVELMI
jgi:large subunit ribosomal protein L7e